MGGQRRGRGEKGRKKELALGQAAVSENTASDCSGEGPLPGPSNQHLCLEFPRQTNKQTKKLWEDGEFPINVTSLVFNGSSNWEGLRAEPASW